MEDEKTIMYKLGGLEALVKGMNDKLDKFIEDTQGIHKDHEKRISTLEKGWVRATAIASVISSVIGMGIGVLLKLWPN